MSRRPVAERRDVGVLRTDATGIDDGHIAVDAKHKTSLDGVYAIGDVTNGLDQIAVAMGQGAIAATAIHNDLTASAT